MSAPAVSIVMPAYNTVRYVEAAVASVHAQHWPEIELVAVDDGSTDGTGARLEEIAAGWASPGRRMVVLRQTNAGAAAARNVGVAASGGTYIALFDADDVCHPGLVRRLVEALEGAPELVLASALYNYVDGEGNVHATQPPPPRLRPRPMDLLMDNVVHAPLFRRAAWEVAGPLDPRQRAHIDLDFFVRLLHRRPGSIRILPDVLSDYRRRPGQITGEWRRMRRNWVRVTSKLAREGLRLTPAERRRVRARLNLYWATLAYQSGDYAAARRLAVGAWAASPAMLWRDGHAWMRGAACLASLLPRPIHGAIRDAVNGRNADA